MTIRGNTAYDGLSDLPPGVRAAVDLADQLGFDHSCAPEQGRLLALLAGGGRGLRIGETGTGCGVGLAWMASTADPSCTLVSVEVDEQRATAAAALVAGQPAITVAHGDWTQLRAHGPFDLLVLDGGGKGKGPDEPPPLDPTNGWLAPGGTIVLDDFTPAGAPGADAHDPARRYWLGHPALCATELALTPELATIVGRRLDRPR